MCELRVLNHIDAVYYCPGCKSDVFLKYLLIYSMILYYMGFLALNWYGYASVSLVK